MTVETLDYTLTSQAEMERLFSQHGVNLRADDSGDGVADTSIIQDSIDYGSDVVYTYTLDYYAASSLATSNWAHRRATIIACWHLSQHRANPANFDSLYEITIRELEKIQSGQLRIPRMPWRSDLSGGVSNFRVDDRFVIKKTRVEIQISTGGRSSKQDAAPLVTNDYQFLY